MSDNGNGLKPKPNGRITTLENNVKALQERVDTLVWLHAELMQHMKMMVAQQLLSNPEVQDRLRDALISQMQA